MIQTKIAMPTPAAAMSLMTLIFSLWRVSTKSHSASIALLKISATSTKAVTTRISRKSTQARAPKAIASTTTDAISL